MSPKAFKIIAVIGLIAVIAGIYVSITDTKSREKHTTKMGKDLFPGLPVNDVTRITITRNTGDAVELTVKDGEWVVVNSDGYPADFSRIKATIITLADLASVYPLSASEADLARLELRAPEKTKADGGGTRIVLATEKGNTLAELIIGKEKKKQGDTEPPGRRGPGPGRYVRIPGTGTATIRVPRHVIRKHR